ncbi:Unknown protein, partial [Striga hermonthica]
RFSLVYIISHIMVRMKSRFDEPVMYRRVKKSPIFDRVHAGPPVPGLFYIYVYIYIYIKYMLIFLMYVYIYMYLYLTLKIKLQYVFVIENQSQLYQYVEFLQLHNTIRLQYTTSSNTVVLFASGLQHVTEWNLSMLSSLSYNIFIPSSHSNCVGICSYLLIGYTNQIVIWLSRMPPRRAPPAERDQAVVASQFRTYTPPVFTGEEGPLAVGDWIHKMDHIFRMMGIPDQHMVACAEFQIE